MQHRACDLHKMSDKEISHPSHVVTAKKCTKKCNAPAELLFWISSLFLSFFFFFYIVIAVTVVVAKAP